MRKWNALGVLCAALIGPAATADEFGDVDIEGVLVPPGLVSQGPSPLQVAPSWDSARRTEDMVQVAFSPALRLVWNDPSGVVVPFARMARDETSRLFDEAGIDVAWVAGGETLAPDEVWVILLDRPGPCEAGGIVLGATPKGGQRASHIWVHLPSVMAVLGLGGRELHALDVVQRRSLGLALGRVIAHEIVHAIAPAVPHGGGLMATRLRARELTGTEMAVPASVASAVVASLSRAPAPALAISRAGGRQPRS